MTPAEFIAKWRHVDLKERSAAQEHFIDLCRLLGHPSPAEADPTGERFCFEKGIAKQGGGDGFADVWKQGFFGWEYKGKHKDLNAAYSQLLLYRDAIIDLSDPASLKEPEWPRVDFIVGNPPFLGGKMLRRELGDAYLDALFSLWNGRVPHEADLCCYWFEKARAHLAAGGCLRAGLLATQGIRGGANREVLTRIQETCNIFWAVSDKDWVLDGANVHISMVAFDTGEDASRTLDGNAVATINPNLTAMADTTRVKPIPSNLNLAFMGTTKGGKFDIGAHLALNLERTKT